jgi:GPH family glycoside/pentoside/hexuronide:cation symporter
MAGYGTAALGVSAVEFFVRVYLLKLYTDVVGLSPSIAGVVLAGAVLWDAVTDPLMGAISDRTRHGAGRRRPWILAGAVATAVTFLLLFYPPALESTAAKAAWLLVTYLAFNTALTMLSVPHAALGGELATDAGVRNRVFGWRFLFTNVGLLIGIFVPAALAGGAGVGGGAAWLAPAVLFAGLVTVYATRGRDRPSRAQGRIRARQIVRSLGPAIRSRPFRPLLAAYFVGSVAMTLNSAIALYYYEHRLGLGEREVFLAVLLPFALVIALSIGGWVFLARRLGKRRTAFIGVFLLGLGTALVYPFFPAGGLLGPFLWAVFGGALLGSVFLLDVAVADVVDLEDASSEGVFFGFWRMAAKVARAGGLVATGVLLDVIGFTPGAETQAEGTRTGIAFLFGPGVGGLFILAALLWLRVPLAKSGISARSPQSDR